MGGVDLSGLWARDVETGSYHAWYVTETRSVSYEIKREPYGKTGKLWTLKVNSRKVAFMAGGTTRRLMDLKRRAQEIENGAEWRPEDAS